MASASVRLCTPSLLTMVVTNCPGTSHSPSKTGALALVAHMTMSAPSTTARALSTGRTCISSWPVISMAKRSRCSFVTLYTRTSRTSRTAQMAARFCSASLPEPNSPTTWLSSRDSARVATPVVAPTRMDERLKSWMMAKGCASSRLKSSTNPQLRRAGYG